MFQANQQIGLYHLVRPIGRGGFGEVWLAEKRSQFVTRKVAIKLPLDEQVNFEAIRQEAELWEKASGHINVLPIIDADICDGQAIIVSEYAEGGSLAEKLRDEGKFSAQKAVEMTIGILHGLDYLHHQKIIHRDIKPQNVLLQNEAPRLADFGISRAMEGTTNSATISGTDAYMAPEAFEGIRNVRTDIWSVGVVLYQLLSGTLPFPQANLHERMFAILTRDYEPLSAEVPENLRAIIDKTLVKSPEKRYQSAKELCEALEKALIVIKHPTFAPTEVLDKQQLDNQTIEDKSILTDQPWPVPATEPQKTPVFVPLVDQNAHQNQFQSPPPEGHPILAADPNFQKSPSIVSQVTEITKTQLRGFHWSFYFLPLGIDLITRIITFYLGYSLAGKIWIANLSDWEARDAATIYYLVMPMGIVVYGILGAFFGLIFPRGTWKWGVLLNVTYLLLIIYNGPTRALIISILVTTAIACLTSSLGSRLSPRKTETMTAGTPQEQIRKRSPWAFYFLALIIGIIPPPIISSLIGWNLVNFLQKTMSFDNADRGAVWLIITLPLLFMTYGLIGGGLGYKFPQSKWKWGIWLNILPFTLSISAYLSQPMPAVERFTMPFAVLTTLFSACLGSYLGARLARRKAQKQI